MIGRATVAPRAVGLLAAAGTILATGVAFMPPSLPWSAPLHVRVEAGDLGEINSGAWVELRGARIGSVDRVDFQNGHSVLELSLDHPLGDLHADTSATIQPHVAMLRARARTSRCWLASRASNGRRARFMSGL